jgi:hypothetical protein
MFRCRLILYCAQIKVDMVIICCITVWNMKPCWLCIVDFLRCYYKWQEVPDMTELSASCTLHSLIHTCTNVQGDYPLYLTV